MSGARRKERRASGHETMKPTQRTTNGDGGVNPNAPHMESSMSFTIRHQEALELEISLLKATLKRNDASHRKTQYLRRLNMALSSVVKTHALHVLWSELQVVLSRDWPQLEQELQRARKKDAQTKKKKEIFWELKMSANSTKLDDATTIPDMFAMIQQRLYELSDRSSKGMVECLSRLEYAAKACLMEVARGFFLALVTVAVASVARIRALLLRQENYVTSQLQLLLYKCRSSSGFLGTDVKASGSGHIDKCQQKFVMALQSMVDSRSHRIKAETAEARPEVRVGDPTGLECTDDCHDRDESSLLDQKTRHENELVDGLFSSSSSRTLSTTEVGVSQDEKDIGETMLDETNPDEANKAVRNGAASRRVHPVHDDAGVDHNAALLEKVKQSTGKKKRKQDVINGARRESTPDPANARKGKKKRNGPDFFDQLFG